MMDELEDFMSFNSVHMFWAFKNSIRLVFTGKKEGPICQRQY